MEEGLKLHSIEFVNSRKVKITDDYTISKQLGEGISGAVFLGTHKITGETRAVKQILKTRLIGSVDFARSEVEVLKYMDHPNIIKLLETYEDSTSIYLVTEVC
jgi:calcium-dependent protein kinase